MSFSSISFLIFMIVVFILYWLIPSRLRWALLLASNVFFYACYEARFLLLIFFMTVVSYLAAIFIEDKRKPGDMGGKVRLIFVVTVVLELAFLLVIKYSDMAIGTVSTVIRSFGIPVSDYALKLIQPLGLSFFTFQIVGYIADVYNGKIKACRHLGKYAVFVSFFPNISSGPIERAGHFLPQLEEEKHFDYEKCAYYSALLLIGLVKKIVIADSLSKYADVVFNNPSLYTGPCFIIATILYTFQIYCDFSGYSDMAVGIAGLLGFELFTNFKAPYFATSIKEFWSRWHISLSLWFRDYVYIPLGGNRVPKWRRNLNLMVTFFVSGLWHGADVTFVVWGLIHGLAQVIENTIKEGIRAFKEKRAEGGKGGNGSNVIVLNDRLESAPKRCIKWLITFCVVSLAWVFFRADSIKDALYVIGHMFTTGSVREALSLMTMSYKSVIKVILMIVTLGLFDYCSGKKDLILEFRKQPLLLRWAVYICLSVLVIVLKIHNGTDSSFIYFQF